MARKKKEQPKETIQGTSEQLPVEASTQPTTEAPTIALGEEYTETDTEVAITENVAVNASEEVLEGTVEKTPEHFLFNVYNQPIPATLITIREMKLQNLVDKVLYAANIGGELHPQGIRLDSAPYICKVLIPTSLVEKYNNLEDKLVYDENKSYLDLVVKAANSPTFLKRLFKVGKKGAIIAPNKLVTKVAGFAVSLKSLFPVEADGSISVGVDKPIYSVDDLKAMKSESLKIVSNWYGLPWENSNQARIMIRKAQEGK